MIWKACERFHVLPPNVSSEWNRNDPVSQAELIAFNQIRDMELQQLQEVFLKTGMIK